MIYHLEIKQIVDYPRCRVYRDFLRDIMGDREIRTNGNSYLFYGTLLLCKLPCFLSETGGNLLSGRPGGMGMYHCRIVGVVSYQIPAPGGFDFGLFTGAALSYLYKTWQRELD